MTLENPREAKALKVGDTMPIIVLRDTNDQLVNLHERLQHHALWLVFYRGEW